MLKKVWSGFTKNKLMKESKYGKSKSNNETSILLEIGWKKTFETQ